MKHKQDENSGRPQIIEDYKIMMMKLINRPKLREEQKVLEFDKLANKFAEGWPFKNNPSLAEYGAEHPYRNELEKVARTASEFFRRVYELKKGRDIGKMDKTELDSNLAYSSKPKKKVQKPEIIVKTPD